MKVTINKLEGKQRMEALNEEGGAIRMDGTTGIGGLEGGFSPMQLLLAGIGGCSAIDILGILEKQKQELEDLNIEVDADKQSVGTYSEFKSIHIKFIFTGDLDPKKVERAIDLSINKYCSVSKALEKGSEIKTSYEIKN
ncbi:MAG: OsmC family protein [Balneolaceae bacterium]|nr:OsmC family protein [Balneolaceae bacterium]